VPSRYQLEAKAARALALRDYRGAVAQLEELLELLGENPNTLHAIAHCYERQNRDREAVAYAERALGVDPRHFPSLRVLARAYVKADDRERAREYLERALGNVPLRGPPPPGLGWWRRVESRLRSALGGGEPGELDRYHPADREWVRWARAYLERETGGDGG